jgi:hypothetical protein
MPESEPKTIACGLCKREVQIHPKYLPSYWCRNCGYVTYAAVNDKKVNSEDKEARGQRESRA